MRKLRVAFVAPSLEILGGQSVQANRLLEAWKSDPDVEAWLVPVNPRLPRPFGFASRVRYLRTITTELCYLPLLFRELRRADVVHVFSASYWSFLLAPFPALMAAHLLGRPALLNYRSGEAPDHLRRSWIARWAVAGADSNVVPSTFLVEVFGRFGIDASIVPNVVDLDRFKFRDRNPLTPRLVSTRNFEALYNVECTLRAFRLVQDRWPNASLRLVGSGPREQSLRALVDDLRLTNITFTGRVHPEAIATHYFENDIYVQSPNIDNMPTSVLEAFASGLPVVSTDAGGVPAILTHGEHGFLAPVNDHRMLAQHVLELLDNPDRSRRMAGAARAMCHRFTWQAVREQWLREYSTVLNTVSRHPHRRYVVRPSISSFFP